MLHVLSHKFINPNSSGVLCPWVLRVGDNLAPTTKTFLQDYFVQFLFMNQLIYIIALTMQKGSSFKIVKMFYLLYLKEARCATLHQIAHKKKVYIFKVLILNTCNGRLQN